MTAWRPGDPIGCGSILLPTRKDRAAYGKACREAIIDSAARHAIKLPTLQQRRDFINSHPATEQLKARVAQLWENRNA